MKRRGKLCGMCGRRGRGAEPEAGFQYAVLRVRALENKTDVGEPTSCFMFWPKSCLEEFFSCEILRKNTLTNQYQRFIISPVVWEM